MIVSDIPSNVSDALERFEARASEDEVKGDLELVCGACAKHVCDIEAGDTIAVLARTALGHLNEKCEGVERGKVYDHDAVPDDMPEPGDRCKHEDCGEDIFWMGPGMHDWMHINDQENQ